MYKSRILWEFLPQFIQNSSSVKFNLMSTTSQLLRIPTKNYYKILRVHVNANSRDIKAAYIRMAKIFHPDRNGTNLETKKHFQDIVEAYEVLSNQQKRKIYDKFGITDEKQNNITTKDYFRDLSKLHSGVEKAEAELSFLEAIRGGKQVVRLNLEVPCKNCEGEKCKSCHGSGKLKIEKDVKIKIPENLKSGDTVNIPSLVEPSKTLTVTFKVNPGRDFHQDGFNVHSNVEISLSQALLGDNLLLRGVYGDHRLRIPPGIQSHTVIKLPGRGIRKSISSTEAGDHIVKVIVVIPRKLTKAQIEIIKEFAKTEGAPKHSPF